MFCSKCGYQLNDDAKFCPKCGQQVIRVEASAQEEKVVNETPKTETNSGNGFTGAAGATGTTGAAGETGEKVDWKAYLTPQNIERFAPIAALMPIVMMVTVGILGKLLYAILGRIAIGAIICKVLFTLLKLLFVAIPIAATVGLVQVVLNSKDKSSIHSWVTPAATIAASLSCIGMAFGWTFVAVIFGLVSVLLGLEFLARIVIARQPMDSPVNPKAAVDTYKQYIDDYRAKYPTTTALEKAGVVDAENSYFDGSGLELLGYSILAAIVCVITCGIGAPWMICKINRWRLSHTVINGKRLTFTGSGASLLGHWILWEVLTVITCGIYVFFLYVALRKWELKHTFIEGEPIMANGEESYFDGNTLGFIGYGLLGSLILTITCGLAYPWVMAMIQKWDTKHQVIHHRRLVFSGTGLGFLGEFIIIFIFTLITCGIYAPWATVRMNKYIIRHTDFC